jgi:signal transduction histidine kinase
MATSSEKPRFQKVFLLLGISVVGIFALAVALGIILFRAEVRHQILQRDGILLTNVARYLHKTSESSELANLDLIDLALGSSRIDGIIAVRAYRPVGELVEQVPDSLYAVGLAQSDRQILLEGDPVIRYFEDYPLYSLFSDIEEIDLEESSPLIEVIAPLVDESGTTAAAIQYWLDGAEIAAEFSQLDRQLTTLGTLFILGGGIIFSIVFLYARARLISMARLLSERNASLEQANAELDMAARTSAIGSVSSHLFHGLKNPLAGLKAYLQVTAKDEEAVAIADRMQSLINETLDVLREENHATEAMFSFEELMQITSKRLEGIASSRNREINLSGSGTGSFSSRKIQLLLLILRNLVENAVDASPENTAVVVELTGAGKDLEIVVSDAGPGLPQSIQEKLFEPVISSKSGGTGIGLAISSALARHIPASLELVSSDANGTSFSLKLSV